MDVPQDDSQQTKELQNGTWAAIASYGMWGLFPFYWKQIAHIDSVQVLCHRVLWSAIFLLIVLQVCGLRHQLSRLFRHRQSLIAVTICGVLIAANWGIYIWAVSFSRVTEASLGYYITPLLSIALGSYFFGEKMDKWAFVAISIACLGVAVAAVMLGKLPWVSVLLAATFSIYGAIKKKANLNALAGLTAETVIVAPFALIWLFWASQAPGGNFLGPDIKSSTYLIVAGPVTAIPLLTFAYAAVRVPLQRIGFIQYFSPTIQLMIGLFAFGERLTSPMKVAFISVLGAVGIYLGTRKWK
jgi:chloramphenicol-sensitive protein RarD